MNKKTSSERRKTANISDVINLFRTPETPEEWDLLFAAFEEKKAHLLRTDNAQFFVAFWDRGFGLALGAYDAEFSYSSGAPMMCHFPGTEGRRGRLSYLRWWLGYAAGALCIIAEDRGLDSSKLDLAQKVSYKYLPAVVQKCMLENPAYKDEAVVDSEWWMDMRSDTFLMEIGCQDDGSSVATPQEICDFEVGMAELRRLDHKLEAEAQTQVEICHPVGSNGANTSRVADAESKADQHPAPCRKFQWLAKALLYVQHHPEWSDARIAKEVGVNKSTLSRDETYQKGAALARRAKRDLPKGYRKAETGDLEAVDGTEDE